MGYLQSFIISFKHSFLLEYHQGSSSLSPRFTVGSISQSSHILVGQFSANFAFYFSYRFLSLSSNFIAVFLSKGWRDFMLSRLQGFLTKTLTSLKLVSSGFLMISSQASLQKKQELITVVSQSEDERLGVAIKG
ncbi:hypothetical protein FGO68_gene13034 [Halteria grandinella]|uniref:Uncharacterized protein n=1 Tax=Halteria grandinella TaxID=5974 RepID=A0A8J8P0X0_HALGN|nr:hypothetical protein FGO68_gene13034 [Halteria grandinella]